MAATRTALFARNQPGGVYTISDLEEHPGSIFFVGSTVTGATDAAGFGDNPDRPFATLDFAIGQTTASKGDVIYLLPGHAETTTAIAADVAGVKIIGLGQGRLRPALTATTGSTDLISVTAANVTLRNLRLVGAASGNTALVNVAAADFALEASVLEPAATPLMSITLAAGSARGRIEDCVFQTTANGPDCAIDVETSDSDNWLIRRNVFNASPNGWDLGVIRANADAAVGWLIEDCSFISCDTVAIDFNSSAGASGVDGLVNNCRFIATAALTSVEDILDTGRYLFTECYAHDATNFTTAGARVPIGTVA